MSLTEKYRPRAWEDFIGQEITANFLKEIAKTRIGKNIILIGPYGTSKTSFARHFAKTIFCKNVKDYSPCNECESCKAISENRQTNSHGGYYETDGRKCPDFTEKLDEYSLADLISGDILLKNIYCHDKSVAFIDEAHLLPKTKQEDMLKLLETPRKDCFVILATTSMEHLIPALQSRFVPLYTKLLSLEDSKRLLAKICQAEGFYPKDGVLDAIAMKAKGHPRDIIKYLEQLSNYDSDFKLQSALEILNIEPQNWLLKFFIDIFSGKNKKEIKDIFKNELINFTYPDVLFKQFMLYMDMKRQNSVFINGSELYFMDHALQEEFFKKFDEFTQSKHINTHITWEALMHFIITAKISNYEEWCTFIEDILDFRVTDEFKPNVGKAVSITQPKYINRKIIQC